MGVVCCLRSPGGAGYKRLKRLSCEKHTLSCTNVRKNLTGQKFGSFAGAHFCSPRPRPSPALNLETCFACVAKFQSLSGNRWSHVVPKTLIIVRIVNVSV